MRPLDGVRVVEAASYVTGPLAALALADLGADVIKIEPPTGDPMRRFGVRRDGLSLHFAHLNRNKRSLTLDLKTSESRDALFELLDGADIFITNWRPSVAARLKLTEDFVRARFPRLIWIRVSGYGQDGPMADFPAFDGIVQARSGVVSHNGDPPRLIPGYLADKVTGLMASHAARERTPYQERRSLRRSSRVERTATSDPRPNDHGGCVTRSYVKRLRQGL